MPKRRNRPHHHSVRSRRLRRGGLRLPSPFPSRPSWYPDFLFPNFSLRFPQSIPPGWTFRPLGRLPRSTVTAVMVALALFACVIAITVVMALIQTLVISHGAR
jgi:fatty acid desaturase